MDSNIAPAEIGNGLLLDHPPAPVAPLVSVIVTNHNYGRFIQQCLAAILNQSYPRIECIVVDDGSSDGSGDLLAAIVQAGAFESEGRSLRVIKTGTPLGQIAASAEGFKKAAGQYIIFFDADDYMFEQAVEAHVTAFQMSRIPVGVSSFDLSFIRGDELVISGQDGFYNYVNSKAGQRHDFCRAAPLFACTRPGFAPMQLSAAELHYVPRQHTGWVWGGTASLCFRREMVELMFRRTPKLDGGLDDYMLGGIHPFTGSILIDRPLVAYRIHEANCWLKSPPLMNFFNYKTARHSGRDVLIAQEVVTTLLLNAGFYAEFLSRDDVFIEAVESQFAAVWSKKFAGDASFSRVDFLRENRDILTAAFGEKTFARWLSRHSRGGKLLAWARRAGLMRLARAVLRQMIGEARLISLWQRWRR